VQNFKEDINNRPLIATLVVNLASFSILNTKNDVCDAVYYCVQVFDSSSAKGRSVYCTIIIDE